jgi:hypothetical protein
MVMGVVMIGKDGGSGVGVGVRLDEGGAEEGK